MPTGWVAELAINRCTWLDDVSNKAGDVVYRRVSPLAQLPLVLCPYMADAKAPIWPGVTPDTQEDISRRDHVSSRVHLRNSPVAR